MEDMELLTPKTPYIQSKIPHPELGVFKKNILILYIF